MFFFFCNGVLCKSALERAPRSPRKDALECALAQYTITGAGREGGRKRESKREWDRTRKSTQARAHLQLQTPSVKANAQKLLKRTPRRRFLSEEKSLLAAQNKQQIAH